MAAIVRGRLAGGRYSVDDSQARELLGYPDGARLLIVNADDFGMSHSGNVATLQAFEEGILTSTTLMLPCPWAPHAMQMLRDHPDLPFGVHLTIVSEHDAMRWGPRAGRKMVSSLIDDEGYFFRNSQSATLLAQAHIEEVECEYRAQIEAVLAAGFRPDHLDWHCLYDGGRQDIFELTVSLAREYGLAMRVHDGARATSLLADAWPVVDRGVLDSYSLPLENKQARLEQLLRDLPVGLSEWAMHPGLGDGEAQDMEPAGWSVRKTDLEFVLSPAVRRIIEEEAITLIDYRMLQTAWQLRLRDYSPPVRASA